MSGRTLHKQHHRFGVLLATAHYERLGVGQKKAPQHFAIRTGVDAKNLEICVCCSKDIDN